MLKKIIPIFIVTLITSACGILNRVPLDPVNAQKITEVHAESSIWQDEIIVRAPSAGVSRALGGGLIGALIDSKIAESRQGKIQKVIEPFYASIDGVDFRNLFWNSLETTLKDNFALKVDNLKKRPMVFSSADTNEKKLALTSHTGYMQVTTSYTLTQDFSRLNIVTGIDLWQAGAEKPIYSNLLYYQSSPVGNGGNESIGTWAANNADAYQKAISEGISQTMKMLKIDIVATAVESPQAKTVLLKKMDGPTPIEIKGVLLDEQNNRAIARNVDGRLYSLPQ